MTKLDPVQFIISKFGGTNATARAIGLTPSAISQWSLRGRIPTTAQEPILRAAKKLGLVITPYHLIFGETVFKHKAGTPGKANKRRHKWVI